MKDSEFLGFLYGYLAESLTEDNPIMMKLNMVIYRLQEREENAPN